MAFAVRNFDQTETIGDKLRTMRRNLNVSLDHMVEKTKIQRRYLEAFEQAAYGRLPESMYAKNFLRTYVKALGGDVTYFLERFEEERGTCDLIDPSRLPRQKVRASSFFAAHRLWKTAAMSFLFLTLAAYLGHQVRSLLQPPEVVVYEPTDEYSTDEAIVTVRGKTEKEAEIFINGTKVLPATDGTFTAEVALERGLNVIAIEGATRHSRKTTIYRRVVLEQDEPRQFGILSTSVVLK